MTTTMLGLSCGAPGGSAEILLKEALRSAQAAGAQVQLVRLEELHLPSGPDPTDRDDAWWFWERLMDADGLIVSSPMFSRTVPGRLKVLADRLLGPNADAAIIATLLDLRSRGEEPAMAFRVDERVLKPRVAGFIAVGGSLVDRWHTLTLPAMHVLTFSMQTAVVDQFAVGGAGTPKSVVLNEPAVARAAQLGAHVASQLGRAFDDATYAGEPGLCPLCHLDVVVLRGTAVQCATCGATGELRADAGVSWTDLTTSVITLAEKREHYREILETAGRHAARRPEIEERATAYDDFDPTIRPDQR
ncbi:flavodoxin family protein [Nostocoides sp. HKS02]|uniref:flavodoxin family protein n=1 Tax=Nostocoides sp. HKS02 TaxID=1813880 RepID=UPI0012B48053|nr:NAD(P)H-dependent oxidoreductase [Tetrasphaera sp. HKS02]QGN57458.1 flavodoxin family protein [Tetrasphaera sp. HKS02]